MNNYKLHVTEVGPDTPLINRNKLDPMVEGYIDCALWSTTADPFSENDASLLERDQTKYTIEEATLAQMIRDCVQFYWNNRIDLEAIYETSNYYKQGNAGHDFWLSRNRHGAGFFDRGNDDVWDRLQESAQSFGPVDLQLDKGEVGSI